MHQGQWCWLAVERSSCSISTQRVLPDPVQISTSEPLRLAICQRDAEGSSAASNSTHKTAHLTQGRTDGGGRWRRCKRLL